MLVGDVREARNDSDSRMVSRQTGTTLGLPVSERRALTGDNVFDRPNPTAPI